MTDSFSSAFSHLHLLKHPFYQAWMAGELSPEVLRDYATQYYYHVDRFPRYLSSLHSLCEIPEQRKDLLNNLNEEEGTTFGSSHPELWLQFAEGLGVSRQDVLTSAPRLSIQNVVSEFFKSTRASFHEGLGALYAYESQVPEIAESKIEGLKNRYKIHDEKTLAFFEVHRLADIEHREVILKMLEALPEEQKQQAKEAAQSAAQALWNFLTEIYENRAVCA